MEDIVPVEDSEQIEVTPEMIEASALEEFEYKVGALCEMMKNDPDTRDRIIAETYVNIASIETAVRGTFQMFQNEGMAGMFKQMFSRKKGKNGGRSEPESEPGD